MRDRYASLREGLVGAWIPSVSGSGLLLPDLSGRGNNGTLTNMGPEDWVSGQYGRALDFDGVNDYVVATCDSMTFSSGVWALSSWIYYKSGGQVFFAVGDTTTTARYIAFLNNGGTLQVNAVGAIQGTVVLQCGAVTTNAWEHITITMTTSGLKVYKNGVEAPLTVISGVNEQKTWANNQLTAVGIGAIIRSNIVIGCNATNAGFRIYNRVLSEPEIKLLSQEPGVGFKRSRRVFDFGRKPAYLPPTPPDYRTVRVKQAGEHASLREGLVGAWCPSVAGEGYTLPDLSGQGNNGTLTNMGPEDWVSSQYGRALDFDGVDDFAQTTLDPNFVQNTLEFTVAVWAKRFSDTIGAFAATAIASAEKGFATLFQNTSGSGVKCARISIFQGIGNNDLNYRSPDDSLNTEWNQITFTGDGTIGGVKIYINGISQPITTSHRGTWSGPSGASTRNLQIAKTRTNTLDPLTPFNGQLDDICIYNRALSESEIKLLASRPGIGLRPQRRSMYYAPSTGARRRRILTSMP